MTSLSASAARRLTRRRPLELDARRAIAIKRNLHELEIEADAAAFAEAFSRVMAAPGAAFGAVRLKRPAARAGAPFTVGERFHGCFSLERVLPRWLGPRVAPLALALLAPILEPLEDHLLSDYAEITHLEGGPDRWLGEYRYLEGTPIAGRSRFTVEPLGPGRCRFQQLFEYQERGALAVEIVQRLASRLHDQVVHEQVHAAARLLGAAVSRSTIPPAYAA